MRVRGVVLKVAFLPSVEIWGSLPDFPLSRFELKVQSGYYTESGKYLGGSPMDDDELEMYACTAFNTNSTCYAAEGNATACLAWTANEVGGGEYETGTCNCESVINDDYCGSWTCAQTEVSTTLTCTGEDENRSCWYAREEETTRCTCEVEAETGTYCASWRCIETEADGSQEFEDYTCVRASSSANYCDAWTGEIESEEEVEVSTCECIQELSHGGVCSYWECQERGLTKCSRGGPSWCNIGVSVGVGGFFGSLGAAMLSWGLFGLNVNHQSSDCEDRCKIIVGFLWMAAWSAGVVIWGGQDGAMYAGIWWGAIILYGLFCRCRRDWKFDFVCHRNGRDHGNRKTQSSAEANNSAAADISGEAEKIAGEGFAVNFETPPAQTTTPPAITEPPQVHLEEPSGWGNGPPDFVEVPGET